MTKNQERILALLTNLSDKQAYPITPATQEELELFQQKARERQVDSEVIAQLVELYQVANQFSYEIVLGFHSCTDEILFEWWPDKQLWLGQKDFNTLRWAKGRFCLGDAGNVSYSHDYEATTVLGLLECCIREINRATSNDKT